MSKTTRKKVKAEEVSIAASPEAEALETIENKADYFGTNVRVAVVEQKAVIIVDLTAKNGATAKGFIRVASTHGNKPLARFNAEEGRELFLGLTAYDKASF